jgi:hypothetical protein
MAAEIYFSCGPYELHASIGGLPAAYDALVGQATLHEEIEIRSRDGTPLFFAVSAPGEWPELTVALTFDPGFGPGFLLIPERRRLFVGAGTTLIAYELSPIRRLWEATTNFGFWSWRQHGDIVLMSAELELAAWDVDGKKLWSTFVEPPWSYAVDGDTIKLDVMGTTSTFPVATGPRAGS